MAKPGQYEEVRISHDVCVCVCDACCPGEFTCMCGVSLCMVTHP